MGTGASVEFSGPVSWFCPIWVPACGVEQKTRRAKMATDPKQTPTQPSPSQKPPVRFDDWAAL